MKQFVIFGLLTLVTISGFAQNTDLTSALDNKDRINKKGVYLSNQEFLDNNPSLTNDFLIEERNAFMQLIFFTKPNILKVYNDSLGTYKRIKQDAWGVCDGNSFYLIHRKKCYLVDYVGRFSKYSIHGWRWQYINMGTLGITIPREYDFIRIVDFKTDKRHRYTIHGVKKLLRSEDIELYNEFVKEKKKKEKLDLYLKKLSAT